MSNDLQNDLDAYVLGDEEAFGPEPHDDYQVQAPPDADAANGMLRRLRGIAREVRTIDALADQEVHRIEAWRADRKSGLTKRAAAIEKALEQWMRAVNRLNPKRKSESLPNGKVALRAPGAGKVVLTNPAAFEVWWRQERVAEITAYLQGHGLTDAAPEAHEVVELVLSRSPLMRVSVEANKTGLKELNTGNEVEFDEQDVEARSIMLDDEVIPGVALVRATVDTCTVTPA